MINAISIMLASVSLLYVSTYALAQGTSQQNYRGGYVGSSSPGTPSSGSNSNPSVAPRNMGTGQGRTEGALGLTPQHQKELGISKQQ